MQQRVVVQVPPEQRQQFLHQEYVRIETLSGKFCLILILKPLNRSVKYRRFSMDTIFSVKSFDPRMFYGINRPKKCLRLAVKMEGWVHNLQLRALPFGISTAPQTFNKVMAEVVIPYLDDLLFFATSKERLQNDLFIARSHLGPLGWIVNLQNTSLNPSKKVQFYQFYQINSIEQKIFLPQEKRDKVLSTVSMLQANQPITVRRMSPLGVLTSTMPAIQWARLHFRSLQAFFLRSWHHSLKSLDTGVRIPTKVKRSLWWWKDQSVLSRGLLCAFLVKMRLTTDASSLGWGAHT